MKRILSLAAVALTAAACGNSSATTCVCGVADPSVDSVTIFFDNDSTAKVDVKDGKFSFELPTDITTACALGVKSPSVSFIPDGSKLTADLNGEGSIVSNKSSVQRRFSEVVEWNKAYMERIRDIQGKGGTDADAKIEEAFQEFLEHTKQSVRDNKDNFIGLASIINLRGQIEDKEMSGLLDILDPVFDAEEEIQELKKAISSRLSSEKGKKFTDFAITQPDGKVLKLSDFVGKGKYVLVDFWASWCGPCRREMPNIKAAYKKYKGKTFDVLSVAVWDEAEDSKKAAAELGIEWNQIINAQAVPTDLYGIEGIPHLILFGPDGSIIERGEALRGAGLDKILGENLK